MHFFKKRIFKLQCVSFKDKVLRSFIEINSCFLNYYAHIYRVRIFDLLYLNFTKYKVKTTEID